MSEMPPGRAIERIFFMEADYGPDVAQRRPPVRPQHLERSLRLHREGVIVATGAFTDLSGSLVLVRAGDETAVRELVESDVYWSAGVWVRYRVREFGLLVESAG